MTGAVQSSRRGWMLRLTVVALATTIGLLGVEIAMRVMLQPIPRVQRIVDDPMLGWDSEPSVTPIANDDASASVFFLGDSFTQDRSWPARTLQHAAAAGLRLDGYVLGVSGYGTTQSLLKLERHFEQYRPQLVLLLFFAWNDLRDNVAAPAIFYSPTTRTRPYLVSTASGVALEPARSLSPATWFLYHTDVSRRVLLKGLLRAGDWMARRDLDRLARWRVPVAVNYTERSTWEPFYIRGEENAYVREAYAVTAEAFRRMRDFLSARGAHLGVIGIDNPFVVDEDVAEAWLRPIPDLDRDLPLTRIARMLEEEGIPFVSATSALRAEAARLGKKMYNPPPGELSGHLEPEGEAVVARIAARMAAQLLNGRSPEAH